MRITSQHLELLGESVWNHTMVLFTHGDWLGDTTIEQYIESEGERLQSLVEKCGNRYHVLNNVNITSDGQITELLEKIEEFIAGNMGCHFEMDRKRLEETQQRRRKEEDRARERLMRVKTEREHLQSLKRESPPLSEFRIVLLGNRQSGKSSSGNTILGREEFDLTRTAKCVKRQGEVAGRQVTVVNAPGWWDIFSLRDTPEITKEEIVLSVSLCPPGPHAVLLVIQMYSCVSEEIRSNIQQHLELLGDRVWSHTMVLFTYGDWLGDITIEQYIESDGALQSLIEKCGNRYHVLNNVNWNDDQVTQLLEKIEEVLAENSGHHFEMERKRQDEPIERRKAEERQKKDLMMFKMEMQHILPFMGGDLPDCITFITEHLEFLGENAWYFLIDKLGLMEDARIKQRIENNHSRIREYLQCIAETCMSLCHLFKNLHETDKRQLADLLNNCLQIWFSHFEVEQLRMEATQEAMEKMINLEIQLCHLSSKGDDTRKIKEHLERFAKNIMNLLSCIVDCLGGPLTDLWVNSDRFKCMVRYFSVGCQSLKKTNMTDNDSLLKLMLNMMEAVAINSSHKMDKKRQEETQKRRRKEEERVRDRLMKVEKQRTHLLSLKRELPPISEFRVVLLGSIRSGKSSSGNTILGREDFDVEKRTAQCVKRQGEVAGRLVTVVEAPGWWINTNIKNTPELTKEEIVLSVSLCPPGPHIILLLIRVADFIREDYMKSIQQHLELLSENVWSHTMVVFTHKDLLANKSIEQYIESKEQLRYLVEKCGNRYHVLNNHNKTDGSQITQLLEKIEENFAGNRGNHFEIDRKRLADTKERRRKEEVRKRERLMKVEKQRLHLQSLKKQSPAVSQFRVVLLGHRGSAKSSSGNTILGREEFDLKRRTAQCVKRHGEVAGRHVTVIEAPGWWKNFNLKSTPELTKQEIMLSVSLHLPRPHMVLLLIPLAYHLTKNDITNIQEHLEFISNTVWSYTMVLFSHGDWLGNTTIEQYIESDEHLRYLVKKCENRYHVLNNKSRDDDQITELLEKIEEIVAGNGGNPFELDKERQKEIEKQVKQQSGRVENREMKVYKQRTILQFSFGGDIPHLPEVRIVLLGYKNSGKSSLGNTILGRDEFQSRQKSIQSVKRQGEVAGRKITVVEAPGWWFNVNFKDTPEDFKLAVKSSVSLCHPGPHAILLLICLDLSHTEQDVENIQDHLEILGKSIQSHTMVLFTHGDWLGDTSIEGHIETERPLQYLVDFCRNRYHVFNNRSRDATQVTELLCKIEEMVAENGGSHYETDSNRSPYRSAPSDSLSASDASSEEDSGISAARSMMDPPNLGGDNRSDITSVSSASCKPISDTASEAPSEGDSGISAARSMMDPPNLGGDDRSDITSVSSASEDLSQTPKTLERNRKLQKVKEGKVISTDQGEIAQEDSQSFSQTNTV